MTDSLETENLPENPLCVVSLSGGMDSTCLLLHLLARNGTVHGISFDYGQKHVLELDRLRANLKYLAGQGYHVRHDVVDISSIGRLFHSALIDPEWQVPEGFYEQENMKETVVPNRNAIFSSISYGYALSIATREKNDVYLSLGVHAGDHAIYPDCRPEFYQAVHQAFATGNWDSHLVHFYLPYLNGNKAIILRDAVDCCQQLGLDFDTVFRNTCTSYAPDANGKSSGRTGSDVERILAFHEIGRKDPIEYVDGWDASLAYALAVQPKGP